uniref:SHC SH2 domain-binding protein 1 n=1 Tax=Cacopsylla melanoneura TaxID=428564 RepID=A0A8D9EQB4_9HEMI
MKQLYSFNKTFEEQYEEYESILLNSHGDEILNVWKSYLSPALETTGWDAQWCIPVKLCQFFGLLYPQYVLVAVEDIDFDTLQATVQIKEEIPDCNLPDSITEVALYDLLPLYDQDPHISLPMMEVTALYLDQYRVFIKHLWWPWDEVESNVWTDAHLMDRLTLYHEMAEGKILFETGVLIKDLLVEARTSYDKILELTDAAETETPEELNTLMELSARVDYLKKQLVFYGDEKIRRQLEKHNRTAITHDWKHCLVVKQGSKPKDTAKLLDTVPDVPLAMESDLDRAIKGMFSGDTLLLGPGDWVLSSGGILELGATLKGVHSSEESRPVLQDKSYERSSWLHFSYNESTLSNLTLNVKHKYGITVCKNSVLNLHNVTLRGEGKQTGLYLKTGSSLLAQNCVFEQFHTAVRALPEAKVTLKQCEIRDNGTALSVICNAHITLIECKIINCSSAALDCKNLKSDINQESNKDVENNDKEIKTNNSIESLQGSEYISIKDCTFENCKH